MASIKPFPGRPERQSRPESGADIIRRRLQRSGLGPIMDGAQLCRQAELLYPGMFTAVSVRNGCLHLKVASSKLVAFKLVEGKLLQDLDAYAAERGLPPVTRIRLTKLPESPTI